MTESAEYISEQIVAVMDRFGQSVNQVNADLIAQEITETVVMPLLIETSAESAAARHGATSERSSRQAGAEEALRLELALERERKITAAYAEQVRMHHCGGVALSHPADPDKKWTLEELSSVTCYKTGEYTPDVCDGTCYACRPTPLESDEGEEPGEAGFTRPQCTVHPSILPCGHTEDEAQRSVRHELCTAPTESFEGGTP